MAQIDNGHGGAMDAPLADSLDRWNVFYSSILAYS
jgi:hypothetical protein